MFRILLLIFLLVGCTTIQYSSDGTIPLAIGHKAGYMIPKEVAGKKRFYLWGIYPKKHVINLNRELTSITLSGASKVTIEEYQGFWDFTFMIASFGMYIPVSYKITCLAAGDEG